MDQMCEKSWACITFLGYCKGIHLNLDPIEYLGKIRDVRHWLPGRIKEGLDAANTDKDEIGGEST